jgi:zinc transport system substrate-binding protein
MIRLILVLFLLVLPLIVSSDPPAVAAGPTVFVSILPQKFFVQQIGGDRFTIEVMVPPGASPHTYEPKPSQMRKLARARAFFTIGVAIEKAWLDKIATINPNLIVVNTEKGIDRVAMDGVQHHDHGAAALDERKPGHGNVVENGLDPHIWLSPQLVRKQAETIKKSLVELDHGNGSVYEQNFNRFAGRIDALDARLRQILGGKQGMKFMVFHPSWGYFARSYGLIQVAVEIEGKSPKPAHLQYLIEEARRQGITVIFAQPQFSRKSAEVIAREIGAEVVLIDPLSENWFENMTLVADKLSRAVR